MEGERTCKVIWVKGVLSHVLFVGTGRVVEKWVLLLGVTHTV